MKHCILLIAASLITFTAAADSSYTVNLIGSASCFALTRSSNDCLDPETAHDLDLKALSKLKMKVMKATEMCKQKKGAFSMSKTILKTRVIKDSDGYNFIHDAQAEGLCGISDRVIGERTDSECRRPDGSIRRIKGC